MLNWTFRTNKLTEKKCLKLERFNFIRIKKKAQPLLHPVAMTEVKFLNDFNISTPISSAAKCIWLPVTPSTKYESYQQTIPQRLSFSGFFFSFIGTTDWESFKGKLNIFRSLSTHKKPRYYFYTTGTCVCYTFTLNEGLLSDCFYPNRQLVLNTRNGELEGQSSQFNYIKLLESCS